MNLDCPPPHDLGSEWALIASVLAQPWDSKLDLVVGSVDDSDFYDAGCRVVFRAIADLHDRKLPVDQVAVKSWLDRKNVAGQVDWDEYRKGLANHSWVGDIEPHIAQVKKLARVRRVIETCLKLAAEGRGAAEDADAFIARAESEIYEAAVNCGSTKFVYTIKEAATALLEGQQKEMKAKQTGATTRIRTGLIGLDTILGPLRPGLIVIAARPSLGKTALTLNIAENVAHTGAGVHFISLETVKEAIAGRVIASNGETNITRVMSGELYDGEHSRVMSAMGRVTKLPITIDDRASLNMGQIRSSIRRSAAILRKVDKDGNETQKLGLVCVDYLQLAKAEVGRNGNREQEVGKIAYGLLEMSREFGVPVIALSQLNRATESRKDARPKMSDIRESGAIEQAANVIIALYRENEDSRGKEYEEVEAIILKSKDSAIGATKLRFRPEWMQFTQDMGGSSEY